MTENTAQSLLDSLTSPKQVMDLSDEQLPLLAAELRKRIIDVVSKNGGHLAPSLGVVELTLALLHTFNMEQDKIVWDVGHQAYAYKLLTGRASQFHTLRTLGGLAGFPRRSESPYDRFGGIPPRPSRRPLAWPWPAIWPAARNMCWPSSVTAP